MSVLKLHACQHSKPNLTVTARGSPVIALLQPVQFVDLWDIQTQELAPVYCRHVQGVANPSTFPAHQIFRK